MVLESRRKANQLEQEKMLAVQKLQTLRQLYPVKFIKRTLLKMASYGGGYNNRQISCPQVKDENSSVDGWNNKTVCPVNEEVDQQRKMVTEQVKA